MTDATDNYYNGHLMTPPAPGTSPDDMTAGECHYARLQILRHELHTPNADPYSAGYEAAIQDYAEIRESMRLRGIW